MAKLKEICDVDWGNTSLTKSAYIENGKYLGVSAGGCDGRFDYYDFEAYTPVISAIGANCGKMFLPQENFVAIKNTITLKPHSCIDGKYLYYAMFNNHIQRRGGGQPFISKGDTEEYEIPCPEKSKQQEIVNLFEKLTGLIESRYEELNLLDELIKARFVELFGDPDTNPLQWKESALSEKLEVLGGYAFKSDGFDERQGIPVLRIGNINAGYFKPVNMVYWPEDEALARYMMFPGDLVMSLTGTVGKDDYGNVCILGDDYECYYLNQRNAKLQIKEGIDKYYLSELLKFEKIKKRLTGISRGVRQANISNKDILNLTVPIPPIELQIQFATFVQQVDKSKVAVQKSLDETQLLFDSLMQQYFG